jgi:NAD(P)-dependent dehydrogenase (short-subunit alcohol dehydrogenase family)
MQNTPVRIIVLSSKGHYLQRSSMRFNDLHYERRRYGRMVAYAQSKLANVLFAKQLAKCESPFV